MVDGRRFGPTHPNGTECLLHFVLVQNIVFAQAQATRLYVGVHSGHWRFASHPSPHWVPDGETAAAVDTHAAQLDELVQIVGLRLGS